jgi:hypothetical protein
MSLQILFRKDYSTEAELEVAARYFPIAELRSQVQPKSLIIGRYSTLPYYDELTKDLKNMDSKLINSFSQYSWIANFEWYEALKEYTFQTWFKAEDLPNDKTEFIVKGTLNSRKSEWDTMMHAKSKQDAIRIMIELKKDSVIGTQDIIFRRFEKLITYDHGIKGLPFTNEWRFFYFNGQLVDYGYYWSIAKKVDHTISPDGVEFANQVAKKVSEHSNFFAMDIAQREDGSWVLVEINDGQSAGLCEIDPDSFYKKLRSLATVT